MPALRCLALSPNQPFLRAVCNAAAAARVQPGRPRCALRLRPLGPPVQGATAAALHAYTRPSLLLPPLSSSSPPPQLLALDYTRPATPTPGPRHTCAHALTGASSVSIPGALLEPSSYPPRTLLLPSCQFVFGPMCGSWMDRADRRLVIRWGIGLQCAGVSLALCTYATQASNLRPADPRQACCCYSRRQAGL